MDRMLRNGRFESSAQMKPYIQQVTTDYLKGTGLKTLKDVSAALAKRDPNGLAWGPPRLSYQLKIAKKKLMGDATTTAPPQSFVEGSVQPACYVAQLELATAMCPCFRLPNAVCLCFVV